mgnify:CR=1 FL=1
MKTIKLLFIAFTVTAFAQVNAQTADEIVENYLEAIGGKENLAKVKSLKMIGKINAQGMEIPIEAVTTNDGSAYVQIDFQGQKMKQLVSNGTKTWSMNMMAQKMEEIPSDMSKIMIEEFKDFPNPFINYKEKGYKIIWLDAMNEQPQALLFYKNFFWEKKITKSCLFLVLAKKIQA